MARLKPATPHGIDPVRRLTYAAAQRIYGRTLRPTEIVAHHPPLLVGYGALSLASQRYAKSVDTGLKELAMLRTAQLVGCEWCLDFGSKLARESGAPEEQLRDLSRWRDSKRFHLRERLALENVYSRCNWALGIESEGFSQGSYCVAPESAAEAFAEAGAAR